MKIKRFNWINKLFTFTQEVDEKLFSSNRQKDIKEWLDLSRSLVYEIIKLVEFYDVGKDNREHWINSLTEKLIIKNNQFSYLSAASLLEDPAYLISSKDIKDRIFENLHGKELLDDVWKKDMKDYSNFIKVIGGSMNYDYKFYEKFIMYLIQILKSPNCINEIDTSTLYLKPKIKIDITKLKELSEKQAKELIKEYLFKVKGY